MPQKGTSAYQAERTFARKIKLLCIGPTSSGIDTFQEKGLYLWSIPRTLLKISFYCFTLAGRRFVLSEQDTETKQNPGPEGSSDETAKEEKEVDHLSDLS